MKQLPVLPPDCYTSTELAFIVRRVLELTYTAHDSILGRAISATTGRPSAGTRSGARCSGAELDAYYAWLYGLTRDELRYVLDPKDVMGEDFPSETFRVLKDNDTRR